MPKKTTKGNKEKPTDWRLPLLLLGAVFLLSFALKLNIVHSQVPEGVVIDWSDVWSFLVVIDTVRTKYHLPVEDPFFGGVPYIYPPLALISYAVLYKILPVDFIFFANNVAPLIGSLAVFGIFFFAYKLTGSRWAGVLAAYLSLFDTRYLALSGVPIPELFGHLQAPIFMYLAYLTAKTKNKRHALLAGLCGATIFLNHYLTAAVLFLSVMLYFALLTLIQQDLRNLKLLAVIVAVSFVLSSPWWIDTINKNIMNIVVSEGESPIPWSRYIETGGPHVVYLGVLSGIIALALIVGFIIVNLALRLGLAKPSSIPALLRERQEAVTLMFAWSFVTFAAIRSRMIAPLLFGWIIEKNPIMLFVFAPIYGTRFFNYIAQPFAITAAAAIITVLYYLSRKIRGRLKNDTARRAVFPVISIIALSPLVYSTVLYGLGLEDPILYGLDDVIHKSSLWKTDAFQKSGMLDASKTLGLWDDGRKTIDLNLDATNWALRSLYPDVNASYEYQASLWMRDNLPENANIVTDYPAGEVVAAGSLRKITTGAELRVTVPLSRIYMDVITMYYTPDAAEAVKLMQKWGSTHIYISQRMKIRGWFSIENLPRFPKFTNSGLAAAELSKFDNDACFRRVVMPPEFDGKIWLYECVCCY